MSEAITNRRVWPETIILAALRLREPLARWGAELEEGPVAREGCTAEMRRLLSSVLALVLGVIGVLTIAVLAGLIMEHISQRTID